MRNNVALAACITLAVSLAPVAQAEHHEEDIVNTALAAGQFKTLATPLEVAGLVGTLKDVGPFTVFAPTDAAFARIPQADLQALLADKAKLTRVLTYHVVAGKVTAAGVARLEDAKTVEGQSIRIRRQGGRSECHQDRAHGVELRDRPRGVDLDPVPQSQVVPCGGPGGGPADTGGGGGEVAEGGEEPLFPGAAMV